MTETVSTKVEHKVHDDKTKHSSHSRWTKTINCEVKTQRNLASILTCVHIDPVNKKIKA